MSSETTNEYSVSVSVEVEVEKPFVTASVEVGLGYSHSSTEARETSSSLSEGVEETCVVKCSGIEGTRTTLWQYKRELVSAKSTMHSSTCHYVCAYDDQAPQCAPSACANDGCTQCLDG